MFDTFLYAFRAVLPILLMITLGYLVQKVGPWDRRFYKSLNKLCFQLFLPMQLFCNVYAIEDLSSMNWRVIGYLLVGIFAALLLGVVCAKLFVKQRNQQGVIVQAAFRSNYAIFGLPLAEVLGGAAAMGFASMTSAVGVTTFNILAVFVLTAYAETPGHHVDGKKILHDLLHNPLIIGIVSGLLLVLLRQLHIVPAFFLRDRLPSFYEVLRKFGQAATPLMIFVLGATLDFGEVRNFLPQLSLGLILRLLAVPVLMIGGALLLKTPLHLTVVEMPALVAAFASPVAVSSAVMVQELGGDDQLASQLVVWSCVLSLATIFLLTWGLRSIGAL